MRLQNISCLPFFPLVILIIILITTTTTTTCAIEFNFFKQITQRDSSTQHDSCPQILPSNPREARKHLRNSFQRIIGGSIPDRSLNSHLISFSSTKGHVCSGSMISPYWALTAAHCFIKTSFTARLGGIDAKGGVTLGIEKVIRHADYNDQTLDFDIALVKMTEQAPIGTKFVQINVNQSIPIPGAFARNTGYGNQKKDSVKGAFYEGRLLQVDIPVVNTNLCQLAYGLGDITAMKHISNEKHICAGHLSGGCGACFGDSGGPLAMFDQQGQLVQIGITSFGNSVKCAPMLGPTVYTRVSRFVDWMREMDAVFEESTNVVSVSAKGSEQAMNAGFVIGNLSPIQSALTIVTIILSLIVILVITLSCVYDRKRKHKKTKDQIETIEQQDVALSEQDEELNSTTHGSTTSFSIAELSGQTMVPANTPGNESDTFSASTFPATVVTHNDVTDENHLQPISTTSDTYDIRPLNIESEHNTSLNSLTRIPTAPPLEQVHIPLFYNDSSK